MVLQKWVFFIQDESYHPHSITDYLPFPRITAMQKGNHFSIICKSYNIYYSYMNPIVRPHNLSTWKEHFKTMSAILISNNYDRVEKELVLYDTEKGIDFPETVF